jgi:CheY-like chemotaxis protein/HPt (histidine-containing phosphotransfer) domain-containing protein
MAVMGMQQANCAVEPHPSAQLVTSHSLKEVNARRAARVLVAEDNKVNQMVAVRMLEKLRVQVDVAVNGLAAAEACQRTSYDMVLMDCQMPEMDGFEATRLILDSESARGGVHIPIAAVTANAMQGDREKCLAAGMDDYIAKPFKLDQIRKLLERWVPALSSSDSPSPTSAPSEQEMSVDTSALEGLQVRQEDGVPNFLAGLISKFLPEARSRLTAIHEAVESADASALMQAAHSLRGSSAVMGAKTLAALCAELEGCARKTEMLDAAGLASQLENEFRRVREELEAR